MGVVLAAFAPIIGGWALPENVKDAFTLALGLEGDEVTSVPVGDVHPTSRECRVAAWAAKCGREAH